MNRPYDWTATTIIQIIARPEYMGHSVNFRYKKESYKSKKVTVQAPEDWVIIENTHECCPYVNTFEPPQKARKLGISWDLGFAPPSSERLV
ncbi:MAG: recombinase family protein [Clostridia bacterium]|nr:recombinase family protein [Clostridia bacterium]